MQKKGNFKMGEKRLRCNKCGELSFNGIWKGHRWFCSDCLETHRISDADTKGSKRERGIPNDPTDKMNKMLADVRSKPDVHKTYGKYIKKNGIFRVKTKFKPHNYILSGTELKEYYNELIKEKVLKEDPILKGDIIKFREKLLQHRILCDVVLHGKEGVVGRLKVYKVLIEHGQEIVDFWVGKAIDPSSLNTLIRDFQTYLKQRHMIGDVSVSQYPTKWSVVQNVETEFEFA